MLCIDFGWSVPRLLHTGRAVLKALGFAHKAENMPNWDSSRLRARTGAALTVHRTVIHSRAFRILFRRANSQNQKGHALHSLSAWSVPRLLHTGRAVLKALGFAHKAARFRAF